MLQLSPLTVFLLTVPRQFLGCKFCFYLCVDGYRHSKYNGGLTTLLQKNLSKSEFYGDLIYKFRKLVDKTDFSVQF